MRDEPVVRVRRVYHRNDPILTMASPMRPPTDVSFAKCIVQSGMIWDEIESAGLSGVKGVWCHEAGAIRMFTVVSIEQMHPGPRAAGRHAGRRLPLRQLRRALGRRGRQRHRSDQSRRRDLGDVDALRSGASTSRTIKRAWSTPLDPMLREPPWESTRAIVNACRPWAWRNEFPEVASASPERRKAVEEKWADEIAKATGRR